ncbi:hypothetical protein ACW95P_01485 [Candidatus Mycoplasma pogonae]
MEKQKDSGRLGKLFVNTTRIWRFGIYDLTIAGLLFAMFLVVNFIAKTTLTGRLEFTFEIMFSILFGLVLGPVKGVILAILGDTFTLLMFGRIYVWMWQYAIVPPLVVLISWFIFYLYNGNFKITPYIPIILVYVTATIFYGFFAYVISYSDLIVFKNNTYKEISAMTVLVITSTFLAFSFIFVGVTFYFGWFKNKKSMLLIALVFALIVFIFVMNRWIWKPIAFIDYWNRFLRLGKRGTRPTREIEDYYIYYLIPAIFKSLFAIPVYVFILSFAVPVIIKLNNKYSGIRKSSY